jgi:DNA-binding MarR family transcriptional regulator
VEDTEEPLATAAAVRRGTMRLARRLRMERPAAGVPLQELSVLAHLNRQGSMTAGEIAAAERVQPQTLTRALAALEAKNAIQRQADPADRRRSALSITAAGRELLITDMRQRDSWLAIAMADKLTPTERQLLRLAGELMERLAQADASALRPRQPAPGTPRAASVAS